MGIRTPAFAQRPRTKRIPEQRRTRTQPPMLPASLLPMKTKVIKRKFKDREDTRTTLDEDAAADAAANAVTPATPQHGGAVAAAGRVEPPQAPSTAWGQRRCKQAGCRPGRGGRKNARSQG